VIFLIVASFLVVLPVGAPSSFADKQGPGKSSSYTHDNDSNKTKTETTSVTSATTTATTTSIVGGQFALVIHQQLHAIYRYGGRYNLQTYNVGVSLVGSGLASVSGPVTTVLIGEVNGVPYYALACSPTSANSYSCSFIVSYSGSGYYTLVATAYSSSGTVLASKIFDPMIEREWK